MTALNLAFDYRFHEETRSQLHQLSHIPFGFGPRYCIGIEYCYLAIKMAVISLLRKYTFVQAPDTEVIRPGKLNSQFIVTNFSVLHAGGRSLFRFHISYSV